MSDTIIESEPIILCQWRDSDLPTLLSINQEPKVMECLSVI